MAQPAFEPTRIATETVDVSTHAGGYEFVPGQMTLHGRFIINHVQGGYSTMWSKILLTGEEMAAIQQTIDAAVARFRQEVGGILEQG